MTQRVGISPLGEMISILPISLRPLIVLQGVIHPYSLIHRSIVLVWRLEFSRSVIHYSSRAASEVRIDLEVYVQIALRWLVTACSPIIHEVCYVWSPSTFSTEFTWILQTDIGFFLVEILVIGPCRGFTGFMIASGGVLSERYGHETEHKTVPFISLATGLNSVKLINCRNHLTA